MRFAKSVQFAIGIATWVLTSTNLPAAQTNVAVAANFTEAAKEIAAAFKAKTGHEAVLSFGASGQTMPVRRSWSMTAWRYRAAILPTRSASSCCGARRPAS